MWVVLLEVWQLQLFLPLLDEYFRLPFCDPLTWNHFSSQRLKSFPKCSYTPGPPYHENFYIPFVHRLQNDYFQCQINHGWLHIFFTSILMLEWKILPTVITYNDKSLEHIPCEVISTIPYWVVNFYSRIYSVWSIANDTWHLMKINALNQWYNRIAIQIQIWFRRRQLFDCL